jgi:hypothetical protein
LANMSFVNVSIVVYVANFGLGITNDDPAIFSA